MKKIQSLFIILSLFVSAYAQQDTSAAKRQLKKLRENMRLYSDVLIQHKSDNSESPDPVFQINIKADAIDSMLKYMPKLSKMALQTKGSRDTLLLYFAHILNNPNRTQRKGIVKFGDDVLVGRNEFVTGDIVVIGGNADIYGEVEGGVIVVSGHIRLASTSLIHKDVVSVFGTTDIDRGAHIMGSTNIFNLGKVLSLPFFKIRKFPFIALIIRLMWFFITLSVITIIFYSFKESIERVHAYFSKYYLKSLVIGVIGIIVLPAVFLILVTTIIGIPVAIFLLPIAVLSAFLVGITACSLSVGKHILPRAGVKTKSAFIILLTGFFAVELPSILMKISSFISPILQTTFFLTVIVVYIIAWIPGFGATIATRFGRK
ncbi:polymer-forming cytoskeletal protein [bacterium]|nr:polymer-forming cytoskeletal protein [bacterium]